MSNYFCALLDIDGTLVDSNDFHVAAWYEAIRECGFHASKEAIHGQIGKGADNLLPYLFPYSQDWQRRDMEKRHGRIFKEKYLERAAPFPDAANFVKWLYEHDITPILASSSGQSDIDHYIALLKIKGFLAGTVSGDDVDHSKPDADIFAAVLAKAGVTASQALAVGDSPYDVISAAKSGIRTIGLLSGGFSFKILQETDPIAIYESVSALLQNIEFSPFRASM